MRALLSILVATAAASAQAPADDSGWFDPEAGDASQRPAQAPLSPEGASAPSPSTAPRPAPPADDANPRALTDFKPHLDPYGQWHDDPQYGTVWVPHATVVGGGFSPYVSGGRWALASSGDWVWVSDYPFGWVVFHYGRWVYIAGHGWAWIPGYRYAPSWVTWRVPMGNYAYVGWAPVGPDFIWVNGRAVAVYWSTPYYWVFCPSYYAFHTHVHRYVVRDRGLIDRLAYSTRHYVPAAPRRGRPASPPPPIARVPAKALPKERVTLTPALPNAASRRGAAPSTERRVPSPRVVRRPTPHAVVPEQPRTPARLVVPERPRTPAPVDVRRRPAPDPDRLRTPGRSPVRDATKFKRRQ